jgi:hypothetical protein
MKKNFPLKVPGQVDARVVEAVKGDVRKYVKRERHKALPAGFTAWNFKCKVGVNAESAGECELPGVSARIDQVVNAGAAAVYVEILAEPGYRTPAPDRPAPTDQA